MSYTLNKTGAQIDVILNRAEAGGQIDQDIAAEAAARAAADALKAPLASPALTGTPTAPTAAPGTDTTQLATTAFANAAAAAAAASAASGKADKVAGATAGNLAGLDASGNLTDAGIAAVDVATKDDVQNITPKRTAQNDPSNSSFSVLCDTAIAGEAKPKLYGKSAVINQKAAALANWAAEFATVSVVDGVATVTPSAQYGRVSFGVPIVYGHIYFLSAGIKKSVASDNVRVALYYGTSGGGSETTSWQTISAIGGVSQSASSAAFRVISMGENPSAFDCKNPMLIDLSLIFSSTELSSIGTDVSNLKTAWIAKFGYPLPQYIPYNQGSIVSNNATYQMHGRNIWDEEWEVGAIINGQKTPYSTCIRSTNYTKVAPNTGYYFKVPANSAMYVNYYDANKNWISPVITMSASGANTTPANACYMMLQMSPAYGTTYNHDICVNLSDASFNGQYEAYYNGGTVTADSLNGIGTAVDSQDAEGAITRRIGIVDLGTLNWGYSDTRQAFNDGVTGIDVTNVQNILCSKYPYGGAVNSASQIASMPDKAMYRQNGNSQIFIKDSAYTDAATFKAAMSNVMLYYELATPTTSTTTPSDLSTQAGYNSLDPVAGDVQSGAAEVEYGVDIIAYIDKKLAEL